MNTEQSNAVFQVEATESKKAIQEYIDVIQLKRNYIIDLFLAIIVTVYAIIVQEPLVAIIVVTGLIVFLFLSRYYQFRNTMKLVSLTKEVVPKQFYDDNFMASGNSYQYDQITKIVVGKLCLFLIVGKLLTVMIKKDDAFTIGDYASFIDFLIEKLHDKPKIVKVLEKEKKKLS